MIHKGMEFQFPPSGFQRGCRDFIKHPFRFPCMFGWNFSIPCELQAQIFYLSSTPFICLILFRDYDQTLSFLILSDRKTGRPLGIHGHSTFPQGPRQAIHLVLCSFWMFGASIWLPSSSKLISGITAFITSSIARMNSTGDSGSPCLTPLPHLVIMPFIWTVKFL